jgi:fructose-specific component phosphotransferase system IIB-like protein
MAIINAIVDITDTSIFTASAQQAITVVYLCNTSNADVTVSVYCVDNDDTTGAYVGNKIYNDLLLTGKETYVIDTEKLILDPSDKLIATANVANVITSTVSYISI